MCQECVDHVRNLFPDIQEKIMGDLLMSCTCFPFGEPDQILEQLKPMAKRYNEQVKTEGWQKRWLHAEMTMSDTDFMKEVEEFRKSQGQNTNIEKEKEVML